MVITCAYNRITGESPTLNDCDKCSEMHQFPYDWCCIEVCGRDELCVDCTRREKGVIEHDKLHHRRL